MEDRFRARDRHIRRRAGWKRRRKRQEREWHYSCCTSCPVAAATPATVLALSPSEELVPLRGAPARIAENMALSATIPLATSQRIIPVKVIDENRRLINHHRALLGKSKVRTRT